MTWEGLNPPYATITADPPWSYRTKSPLGSGGVEAQYSTLSAEDVAALPVRELAAKDAHVYLWCTNPLLFEEPTPAQIMAAWGFRYVTLLTWVKRGALGMGYYFRGETEHIAFGVRGTAPIPPDRRVKNVFEAQKHRHSAKPAAFYDLVEQVSPGPYVELFARAPRLGWDHWGHGYES